jgi:hypothetical protein
MKKTKKKTTLELMKSSRVKISMDTSQIIMNPQKGKGSYRRKLKHHKQSQERE